MVPFLALRHWILLFAALAPALSLAAETAATTGVDKPDAVPTATAPAIAIVLPLASSSYGRAAEAVKAGFLAAAQAAGSESRVRVIGHGDDNVLPAIAAAWGAGVALVVGPLTRDDVRSTLALDISGARLLALNTPEDGSILPEHVYALTLAVESDGAQLARIAREDGARIVAEVVSDTPYEKRLQNAFTLAWEKAGGRTPTVYHFDPGPEMLRLLRRELRSHAPDAILLSVSAADAALAKSFLPPVPVYASSQIADDRSGLPQRDLDKVRYIELPWLAEPDNATLSGLPRGNFGNNALERLYALGIDAFSVALMLTQAAATPERIELDGATGRLTLMPDHTFAREGRLMMFREGRPVPVEPGR